MARQRASRVTKRGTPASSSRNMTRQRSRVVAAERMDSSDDDGARELIEHAMEVEAMRSIHDGGGEDAGLGDEEWQVLEADAGVETDVEMVESQEYFDARSQPSQDQGRGKGRLVDVDEEEEKVAKVFPFMELPTEIRLEIYRACLTRPYKILLSKTEKPRRQLERPPSLKKREVIEISDSDSSLDDEMQNLLSRSEARYVRDLVAADARGTNTHLRRPLVNGMRNWALRRFNRAYAGQASAASSTGTATNPGATASASNSSPIFTPPTQNFLYAVPSARGADRRRAEKSTDQYAARLHKPQSADPLIINILRASKQVYKEARGVLYSENVFTLDIGTAVTSLAALHQRSRRHIKHIELEIPTYTDILERFSEIVRLSLRYCSGLKKFVIFTPFTLPAADGTTSSSNTTLYANGFDILRWLPQHCEVVLKGNRNVEIESVVRKHLGLARTQDKLAYARRQLISDEPEVVTVTY